MLGMILSTVAVMSLPESDSRFLRTNLPRGNQVFMELFIAPDGKVLDCELLVPKLETAATDKICAKTLGKTAAATPPLGPDGNPVHGMITAGIFRVQSGFRVSAPPAPRASIAVEVTVNKLPDNLREVNQTVLAFIDEKGTLTHCSRNVADDSSGQGIACKVAATKKSPVRRGQEGKPVAYLTYVPVVFTVG